MESRRIEYWRKWRSNVEGCLCDWGGGEVWTSVELVGSISGTRSGERGSVGVVDEEEEVREVVDGDFEREGEESRRPTEMIQGKHILKKKALTRSAKH